jgi:hypothetical protein
VPTEHRWFNEADHVGQLEYCVRSVGPAKVERGKDFEAVRCFRPRRTSLALMHMICIVV